jgi:hypothetical protein
MNARVVAILVVLLIVLGGGALLYQRQEAERRPESAAALGQRLFKDLKAADVAVIRIVEPQATLTIQRKEQGWAIAERDGFPADLAAVRDFVLKAIELKVGQSEPIGEKDRARLNLDASGTRVELQGADGKALGTLVVGKKYFKREVADPAKGAADGRFVQRPDSPGVVYVVPDALEQASADSAKWIDRASFKVEKVKSLEVRYPDGAGYRIERARDDADWKLDGARAGEKLEVTKANAASYTLSLLELADVPPKDVKNTGLEKPIRINAATLEGISYEIRVGREQGDDYFVAFKSTSEQPREKLLSQHVLLIPKAKLDDTLIRRDELLAKKPDTK